MRKLIMWFLVRRWIRKIKTNPDSEEVIQMAAQTGNIRKLETLKEQL